jgi:hypothetical protein
MGALSIGSLRVALGTARVAGVWYDPSALLDADYENGRYRYAGAEYGSEAAFNTAIGATKSGITRTIAPKVIGEELVPDPGFDGGITGWAMGLTFESVGVLSHDATNKKLLCTVATRTGAGGVQARYGLALTTAVSKAYRVALRNSTGVQLGGGGYSIGLQPNNAFGASGIPTVQTALDDGALIAGYAGANATTMYLTATTNTGRTSPDGWDDASVKEVVPLVGHNHLKAGVVVKGTTPAAASGNKVVFQADTDNESFRLRIVWDANKHFRVITTSQGTEQANLDLGVVEVSTDFEVKVSATGNALRANVNGGTIAVDSSCVHPAMAYIRVGRSFTGETWDGAIKRVRFIADTISEGKMTDPRQSFMVFGDSTANGDGAGVTTKWYDALRTAYDPDRSVAEAAQGGETTAQMLARVQADTDHRQWTTIFMDRPNTGESSIAWLANVKAAVSYLGTQRWFVVPPVINSPSGQPDTGSGAAIGEIQSALLSDPFWTGHTFDGAQQAAYIATMNDDATRVGSGDWTHFNNTGQAAQATAIKAALDALGW